MKPNSTSNLNSAGRTFNRLVPLLELPQAIAAAIATDNQDLAFDYCMELHRQVNIIKTDYNHAFEWLERAKIPPRKPRLKSIAKRRRP
jgi:hypothetical protein